MDFEDLPGPTEGPYIVEYEPSFFGDEMELSYTIETGADGTIVEKISIPHNKDEFQVAIRAGRTTIFPGILGTVEYAWSGIEPCEPTDRYCRDCSECDICLPPLEQVSDGHLGLAVPLPG